MILKGSQRAGSKQLANHLLNAEQNEHVTVHEVSGFLSDDLDGALTEIYATSKANKNIKKFIFSMSINPPIGVVATTADFEDAINRSELELGLKGQPRAIVFHEKNGRRHAHCVWSRIDENLKAIKLPYFKKRLFNLSKELYIEHGWDLPKGFQNKQERDPTNFNLSEWQIAKRQKIDPKIIKLRVQEIWKKTNDLASFKQALATENLALAKGDKKNTILLVDIHGDTRSLARTLSIKAVDVKAKLGDSNNLQTINEAKQSFAQAHKEEYTRRHEQLIQRHNAQLMPHKQSINALVSKQKTERENLNHLQEQKQQTERQARQAQYQKGLKGLWHFVTGQYHKQKQQHEAEYAANLERDAFEKEELLQRQIRTREGLQQPVDALKAQHQTEMLTFNNRFVEAMQKLGIERDLTAEFRQQLTQTPEHQPTINQHPTIEL